MQNANENGATDGAPLAKVKKSRKSRKKQKRPRLPVMGQHSTGQARVTLNGKVHYLGQFGSIEAQTAYAELLARWESNGRRPLDPTPDCEQVKPLRAVFALWTKQLTASGRYIRNGAPTSAHRRLHGTVEKFLAVHGGVRADRFSERNLVEHRDLLERSALTRIGINRAIGVLKTAVRWGFERGHFSRDVWLSVAALSPLSRAVAGHRDIRHQKRAPSPAEIESVAAAAPAPVSGMIRVQALLGCRPGELVAMRQCDIDRSTVATHGAATYVVSDSVAKSARHGSTTRYAVVPAALAIVDDQPSTGPAAPVFESPAVTELKGRRIARPWSVAGYRSALAKACARAGVEVFSPHEIRHATITEAARRYGAFAASSMANHSRLATTESYLHKDDSARYKVALGLAGGAP